MVDTNGGGDARACELVISKIPEWSLQGLNDFMKACSDDPLPNDEPHNKLMAELRAEILTRQLFNRKGGI